MAADSLTLEQSDARRMAAEAEADKLRGELAAKADSERTASAQAAMRASLETGGDIGALKRDNRRLQQQIDDLLGKYNSTYGENGVEANGGVIRGNGSNDNDNSPDTDSTFNCVVSFSGRASYTKIKGIRVGSAES